MMHQLTRRALIRILVLVHVFYIGTSNVPAQTPPSIPKNQLQFAAGSYRVNLQWLGDSMAAGWEPHAALLLPVSFAGRPELFYMQFDLGSPVSLLYTDKVGKIRSAYPDILPLPDSSGIINNLQFRIGSIPVFAKQIQTRDLPGKVPYVARDKKSSDNSAASPQSFEVIGTIGADFIDNRIVIIDYPNKMLMLESELPADLGASVKFSDFVYAGRSVLLPAKINGRETLLFFDTGSSAFELLTDKKTAESLSAPGASKQTYNVSSWGSTMTAHTTRSPATMEIGSSMLPLQQVTYMEGATTGQVEMMMKMGIGGMTGNKVFIRHRLIIDTRTRKFAVTDSGQN